MTQDKTGGLAFPQILISVRSVGRNRIIVSLNDEDIIEEFFESGESEIYHTCHAEIPLDAKKDIIEYTNTVKRTLAEQECERQRKESLGIINKGLTKREWFAGMALSGYEFRFYANYESHEEAVRDSQAIAKMAYIIADAMLEAGNGDNASPDGSE